MEIPATKDELFDHMTLASDLLTAERAMKSMSLNLASLRFANHRKLKETLEKTERLYSEIRTLRESIGNEFQKLFEGLEEYDTPRLHYAYRGGTIKEIDKLFQEVGLCLDFERVCREDYQDPF